MTKFIEENEKLLKFYSVVLRLLGWVLLIFSLCSSFISFVAAKNSSPWYIKEEILKMIPRNDLTLVFLALFGISLAHIDTIPV